MSKPLLDSSFKLQQLQVRVGSLSSLEFGTSCYERREEEWAMVVCALERECQPSASESNVLCPREGLTVSTLLHRRQGTRIAVRFGPEPVDVRNSTNRVSLNLILILDRFPHVAHTHRPQSSREREYTWRNQK